jgi:hypothetical protein
VLAQSVRAADRHSAGHADQFPGLGVEDFLILEIEKFFAHLHRLLLERIFANFTSQEQHRKRPESEELTCSDGLPLQGRLLDGTASGAAELAGILPPGLGTPVGGVLDAEQMVDIVEVPGFLAGLAEDPDLAGGAGLKKFTGHGTFSC